MNRILLFALAALPATLVPLAAYAFPRNPFAYYQVLYGIPY